MADQVQAINVTAQNAAAANGNGTVVNVGGLNVLGVQVKGIAGGALVNFEGTVDGTNWVAIPGMAYGSGLTLSAVAADNIYIVPICGLDQFRARISNYASGAITVSCKGLYGGSATEIIQAGQPIRFAAGSAAPGQTLKTYTGKVALSGASTTSTALYTVTAGKTFYITDMYLSADGAQVMDVQVQAAGVTVFRAAVKGDTAPLAFAGIETQPSGAGGSAMTILWPISTNANAFWFLSGFEQ